MKILANKVVKKLIKKKLKVSFVESCTGGLLSSSITSPTWGSCLNIDLACVVLAICVHALAICTLILSYGSQIPSAGLVLTWAIVGTLLVIIKIYYYAILGSIIMSFVMMFSGSMNPHPMLLLIWQLTEPIMAPVRQIIPPLGGLDLSPILIFLIIRLLQDFFIGAFDLGRYSAVILGL